MECTNKFTFYPAINRKFRTKRINLDRDLVNLLNLDRRPILPHYILYLPQSNLQQHTSFIVI